MSFVLYIAYHGLALCLCLWAAITALPKVAEHGTAHRAWTLVAALGSPPALFAACFASGLGHPELRPIGAVLPILAIAATWSNTMTLRDQGIGLKLLHAPVVLWNTALAAVMAVRVYQDLTGHDLGTAGTALVAGHAFLQRTVGAPDAMSRPLFLHLPLCLPLCLRYLWPQRLLLWTAAAVSSAMVWGLAVVMPFAWQRTHDLREQAPSAIQGDSALGVSVPWAEHLSSADARDAWRSEWLGLGAQVLAFAVDQSVFDDPERLQQTRDEITFARTQGRTIVAVVRPSKALYRRPASDLDSFANAMAKTQWLCAEQLVPDVLVLHAGPYGRLLGCRVEIGTVGQWFDRIAHDAQDVRRANPDVRLAVVVETRALHGARLFERLCADDSPVDIVGLSIDLDRATPHDVQVALETWTAWLMRAPGTRPVWVMDTGLSVFSGGGELGQANTLGRLLQFAAREHRVEALVVDQLVDAGTGRGLVTPGGRSRLSYRRLRDFAFQAAPRPPR